MQNIVIDDLDNFETTESQNYIKRLRAGIIRSKHFTKHDLEQYPELPVGTDHADILDAVHTAIFIHDRNALEIIRQAQELNKRKYYPPVEVPTFEPLELKLSDVVSHYKMTETSVNLENVDKEIRDEVTKCLSYFKMQRDLTQKAERSMTQTRKFKI